VRFGRCFSDSLGASRGPGWRGNEKGAQRESPEGKVGVQEVGLT
jgi:hypothetical protein